MDNINDNIVLSILFVKKNKKVPSKDHNDESKQPKMLIKHPNKGLPDHRLL